MRSLPFVVLLWAIATPALAFDWQFEYVDPVGSWSSPSLRMSGTGVLHFCYRAPGNRIAHSYLDSVWHREEIVPPDTLGGYAMDAGPHGEFGLVLHLSSGYWLYEKQDTSWRRDSVPVPLWFFRYDSAGVPSGVFKRGDTILYARRAESTWISETVVVVPTGYNYGVCELTYTVEGEPCVVIYEVEFDYVKFVFLYIEQADTWVPHFMVGAPRRSILDYLGCAPDTGGGAAVLYNYSDEFDPPVRFHYTGFRTGGSTLGTEASAGAAVVHSSGVPHVAYAIGQLRYACRVGTTWCYDTIFSASSLRLAGIVLEDSLPTIGFIDPATGVWLARRQPAGIQEHQQCPLAWSAPTIVRGVLLLPERASASYLLDASGRNVLNLHSGANDVRTLAPGVYFVRRSKTEDGRPAADITKVVVAR